MTYECVIGYALWPYRKVQNLLITLSRVLYWLPIIWKDRWWDSSFLLRILEAKLRYDSKRYAKYGHHVGNEREARQMLVAAVLCKRLADQNYTTPWDQERDVHVNQFFDHINSNSITLPNGVTLHSSRGFVPDPLLNKKARWATEREDEMAKQDLELLTNVIRKHLLGWWD